MAAGIYVGFKTLQCTTVEPGESMARTIEIGDQHDNQRNGARHEDSTQPNQKWLARAAPRAKTAITKTVIINIQTGWATRFSNAAIRFS
jgi:hypothetical protein